MIYHTSIVGLIHFMGKEPYFSFQANIALRDSLDTEGLILVNALLKSLILIGLNLEGSIVLKSLSDNPRRGPRAASTHNSFRSLFEKPFDLSAISETFFSVKELSTELKRWTTSFFLAS
eukprot:TRINITY_DN7482_c0_g1_i4.p1 TRINITY_DN7482_c0_g1~~TRINITY_DN7482_c0_g1_i4.p1  ORF type:complete len:119 (-),score=10.56 TRINITY_DN7482_c0_g1_i4:563-919(-)